MPQKTAQFNCPHCNAPNGPPPADIEPRELLVCQRCGVMAIWTKEGPRELTASEVEWVRIWIHGRLN